MRLGRDHLIPNSATACPEWRWLRAQRIFNEDKRSLAFEKDAKVIEAYQFIKATESCSNDYDYEDLFRAEPDKFTALQHWIDPIKFVTPVHADRPTVIESRRQAALEAYLLTGVTRDVVAERMGISIEAVGIYESWFYDFRPHFNTTSWISTYAIRGDVAGTSGCYFDHILRLVGWKGGLKEVNELLAGIKYSESTINLLQSDTFHQLLKGSAVSSRNVHHQATLFEAMNRMVETVDKRKEIEILAGKDFKSEGERDYILQTAKDIESKAWCMVDTTKDVEDFAPAVEKRIAVQLGYEPDLSIHEP
jgi:hypothetical protein